MYVFVCILHRYGFVVVEKRSINQFNLAKQCTKILFLAGILRDKTMGNQALILLNNDDIKIDGKKFEHC